MCVRVYVCTCVLGVGDGGAIVVQSGIEEVCVFICIYMCVF